jgi:hypothetical protein
MRFRSGEGWGSGPGFDWPVTYKLVWTPIYDRYVVTASADCPDAFGYADFALGHFGRSDDVGQSVIEIIKRDWTMATRPMQPATMGGFGEHRIDQMDAVEQLADQVCRSMTTRKISSMTISTATRRRDVDSADGGGKAGCAHVHFGGECAGRRYLPHFGPFREG